MAKKISHKEVRRRMKMDEMAEAEHWLVSLWQNHGQKITWGLVGVAVLVVAFYLYMDWRHKSRFQALSLYQEALRSAGLEKYDDALPLVEQLIGQSAASPTRGPALMLKGDLLYAKQDWQGALSCYEQVLNLGSTELAVTALLDIGRCQENLAQTEQAEATYRKLLKEYPDAPIAEETTFLLAQLLERQGKVEEAKLLYRQIPEKSAWYSLAKERADWLDAPVVSVPS